MKIQCSHCTHSYEIDGSKIPESGAKVKCAQCDAIFDVIPNEQEKKIYVRIDQHNWFEAASMDEIKEWIKENRLLRTHQLSNDQENWTQLDQIEELKGSFDQSNPVQESNQVTEDPIKEEGVDAVAVKSEKNPFIMQSDAPKLETVKKLDYADYEDGIPESMELSSFGKQRKTGLWFMLLLIGITIGFVFLKPKLTKKIIHKITQSEKQDNDSYRQGIKLLKKYDLESMKQAIKIFQAIQKEQKDHLYAIAGEVVGYFMVDQYLAGELKINQAILKSLEEGVSVTLTKTPEELKKRIKIIEKKRKELNNQFPKLKRKVDHFTGKQLQVARGILMIIKKDQSGLKRIIEEAEKPNRNDVLFLKSYLDENRDHLKKLARYHYNYIPLHYRRMVEQIQKGNYAIAATLMEVMLAIHPKNSYIAYLLKLVEPMVGAQKIEPTPPTEKEKIANQPEKQKEKKSEEEKKDKNTAQIVKPTVEYSFDQLMKQADQAFNRERKGAAYKLYKQALKKQASAKASAQMGWILFDWGKNRSAISLFKRAVNIDHNYLDAYLGLGEVYMADNDSTQAKRYLKILVSKSPHSQEGKIARNHLKKLK